MLLLFLRPKAVASGAVAVVAQRGLYRLRSVSLDTCFAFRLSFFFCYNHCRSFTLEWKIVQVGRETSIEM